MISALRRAVLRLQKLLINDTYYVFFVTLAFYILVFFFNQTNKTLLAAIFLLMILFWRRLKNLEVVVFLTYLVSLAFTVGKTFEVELIPAGFIQSEYFPNGLLAQIVIRPNDILFFAMALLILRAAYKKMFVHKLPVAIVFLILFNLVGLLSAALTPGRMDLSLIWALQSCSWSVIALFTYNLAKRIPILPFVLGVCSALVIFEALITIGQYLHHGFLGSSIESTAYISAGTSVDEDVFTFRSLGTFSHPNSLAQMNIFIIPIFLSILYISKIKYNRFIAYATLAAVISLILTQGRSAWFSFGCTVLLLSYVLQKKWRLRLHVTVPKYIIIEGASLIVIIAAIILPSRLPQLVYSFEDEAGGTTRILLIREWATLILRYPVLGVGPGMSVLEGFYQNITGVLTYFPEAVHNVYLIIASERGLLGLFLFILYIYKTSVSLFHLSMKKDAPMNMRVVAFGVLCGSLGIYLNFLFQPYFDTIMYAIIFHTVVLELNKYYDQATKIVV